MAAESIYLKEKLKRNPDPIRPFHYYERTENILLPEDCQMQEIISELKECEYNHDMVINKKKTKAIIFNQARNYAEHFNRKRTVRSG